MQCRMIMSQSISLNLPFPPLIQIPALQSQEGPGRLAITL